MNEKKVKKLWLSSFLPEKSLVWTSPTIAKALQHKDDYPPDPRTLRCGSVFGKSSKAAHAAGTFVTSSSPQPRVGNSSEGAGSYLVEARFLTCLRFILPVISTDNSNFLSYQSLPSPLLGITLKALGSCPWKWLTPATKTHSYLTGRPCPPFKGEGTQQEWEKGGVGLRPQAPAKFPSLFQLSDQGWRGWGSIIQAATLVARV